MTAALLDELAAAGVRLSLAGDALRYQIRPGMSIAPYREPILSNKPSLLSALLKKEIMAVLNVEAANFDRPAYLRLLAQFKALEGQGEMS